MHMYKVVLPFVSCVILPCPRGNCHWEIVFIAQNKSAFKQTFPFTFSGRRRVAASVWELTCHSDRQAAAFLFFLLFAFLDETLCCKTNLTSKCCVMFAHLSRTVSGSERPCQEETNKQKKRRLAESQDKGVLKQTTLQRRGG